MLKNKFAVVTGASSGIGKQIAKDFVINGASIAIISRDEKRLNEAFLEIEKEKISDSQKIIQIALDVSKFSLVENAFQNILKEFERIDILVNNAGITKDNLLMKMTEDEFDSVIDINLKSVYNTCKVVKRPMMKMDKGKIINISSIIGLIGNAGQTNYAASKAAVIGFSKSLAKEVGSRNINVNVIAPGYIETKMTENLKDEFKVKLLSMIPLKRFGNTKDVSNLCLFLASEMSDYITGQVYSVDGGLVT